MTRSSMSLQSLDTLDLLMPVIPIAWTSSSTRRVLTPTIHASWMTDTSAFSTVSLARESPESRSRSAAWALSGLAYRAVCRGCGRDSRCARWRDRRYARGGPRRSARRRRPPSGSAIRFQQRCAGNRDRRSSPSARPAVVCRRSSGSTPRGGGGLDTSNLSDEPGGHRDRHRRAWRNHPGHTVISTQKLRHERRR